MTVSRVAADGKLTRRLGVAHSRSVSRWKLSAIHHLSGAAVRGTHNQQSRTCKGQHGLPGQALGVAPTRASRAKTGRCTHTSQPSEARSAPSRCTLGGVPYSGGLTSFHPSMPPTHPAARGRATWVGGDDLMQRCGAWPLPSAPASMHPACHHPPGLGWQLGPLTDSGGAGAYGRVNNV